MLKTNKQTNKQKEASKQLNWNYKIVKKKKKKKKTNKQKKKKKSSVSVVR